MSIFFYFFKAYTIGITIAAPVGPIGLLCIQKTLQLGLRGTFSVGLGAAVADSIYGLVAATGLTTISYFLFNQAELIRMMGGVFLLYLAYKEINSSSQQSFEKASQNKQFGKLACETFFLTLANPMTILSFISIFASINTSNDTFSKSLIMILGVFLGSMTWWLMLGISILKFKNKLPDAWINNIKYLSAGIIGLFGFFSIIKAFL